MGKAIDFLIEFRLHESVATELRDIYEYHLDSYDHTDLHEQLLAQHIKDTWLKLNHMLKTMQKTAKLRMNNSEAMAFYQIWNTMDTTPWPLANVILADMIRKVDKRISVPKKQTA